MANSFLKQLVIPSEIALDFIVTNCSVSNALLSFIEKNIIKLTMSIE